MVCLTSRASSGTSPVVLPPKETDDSKSVPLISPLIAALTGASVGCAASGALAAAAPLSTSSSQESVVSSDSCGDFSAGGFFVPQLLQNASPGTVVVPHLRHSAIYSKSIRIVIPQPAGLLHNLEAQKSFSDDNLVAVAQWLTSSLRQSFSPVDKRAIGRSHIFQQIHAIIERDPSVAA